MSSTGLTNKFNSNNRHTLNTIDSILSNSIHNIESKKYDKCSYEIDTESYSNIKDFQISKSSFSKKNNRNLILQIKSLAKEKIIKRYNCTKDKYNSFIINNILRNDYCRIVSLFKDILLNYLDMECLHKYNKKNEIKTAFKKFYSFYENYFQFYCKPIFNCISICFLMKHYYEIKLKCFLNIEDNLQENSNNNEGNISKSSYSNVENKTIVTLSDSQNIFNSNVKESLENVTIMFTEPEHSEGGTINFNFDEDRLDVDRENKREYSNNSTFVEIINSMRIKKKEKSNLKKKNKIKNKIKKDIIKCNNKNHLLKNRNNNKHSVELNNINLNILNNKKDINKNRNKKKIPINKVNDLLKKLKTNNIKMKINRNLLNNNINKSSANSNTIERNKNKICLKKNIYLNLKRTSYQNSNLSIYQKFNKTEKSIINKRKKLNSQNFNNVKEIINKDNINNNISSRNKNSSKSNMKSSKEIKIINQKDSSRNSKKVSRNRILFEKPIQNIYFVVNHNTNTNTEYKRNIKSKKLSMQKPYINHKPTENNNIKLFSNKQKTIGSIIKNRHIRHNTKIIKNNIEKIFKKLYPKIKKVFPNKANFNTIHINKSLNLNKSHFYNTQIIDNNINTINTEMSNAINSSIQNYTIKKYFKNAINKNRKDKSRKLKMKFPNKNYKTSNQIFNSNFNNNSINITQNNKAISLLYKTCHNNYCITSSNNLKKKRNHKSLKNKRQDENSNSIHKRIKNIKSIINQNIKKPKISSDFYNFGNFKKINSFNTQGITKNGHFQTIINEKNDFLELKNKIITEKSKDKKKENNRLSNYKMNYDTNVYNSNLANNKENKKNIKYYNKKNTKTKNINNTRIMNKNCNMSIKDKNYVKIINSFHNKSLSTYGMSLDFKKMMKFKI